MIKFFLIPFIFLFSINIALASDISQFVFTTTQQTIKPNTISEKLTIQAQDASGNSFNLPQTGCLQLKTTSATGEFSSSNTSWNPVNILIMNKGTANRSFYYKDSTVRNYVLTINIALRPESETKTCADWQNWPAGEWNIQWTTTQNIIISEQQSQPQTSSSSSQSQSQQSSEAWPTEPQIYANAGEDKTAVVGADVYFSGQALGLQKEPLENARYLWNFGDGASSEGQNVKHFYRYPGEYIVVLDVSSGKYSTSDRALVKIIPNQIIISEANKDFIKLFNGANIVLDISDWYLRVGDKTFKLPASTLIKANSNLIIPSSNSGLEAGISDTVDLLYPNGSKAFSWQKPAGIKNTISEKESEPTSIVSSKETIPEVISTSTAQTANVITASQDNSWSLKKWLIIILGIGIIAAAGFILIRRQGSF